jgi:hypothetical protein
VCEKRNCTIELQKEVIFNTILAMKDEYERWKKEDGRCLMADG